jgi:hypothetical protein
MTNSTSLNGGGIQTELWIGHFQAGKTSSAVQHAYETTQTNPKIIPVFIAYGTNSTKENQERHIRRVYGESCTLINTSDAFKAFKVRAQKGCLDYYNVPIVISVLGHWASLESLQNILTTKSDFEFHLWLDESDTYSLDFDNQDVTTRKDNLIDSIKKLEYHKVSKIHCITATPLTEMLNTTDFSIDPVYIEPGEGYIGISTIFDNAEKVPEEAIRGFKKGTLSPELQDYFLNEAKKVNTVTIVSISNLMSEHKIQAESIAKLIDSDKVLVVEFNSNRGTKYFSKNEIRVTEKHNRKDQLQEMFDIAQKYDKLFIVGSSMMDRSVTLKGGKFKTYSSMLFSAGRDPSLAPLLQRVSRVCGYQTEVPKLYTDLSDKLFLAGEAFEMYIDMIKDKPLAKDRRKALLELGEKFHIFPNAFGRYRNNNVVPQTTARTPAYRAKSVKEAKELGYQTINKVIHMTKEELKAEIVQQLNKGIKCTSGTPLHKHINSLFFSVDKILNVKNENGSAVHQYYQLPNNEDINNFRNTLYYWEDNILSVSNQPYPKVNRLFAIEDLTVRKEETFDCYSLEKGVKFT